MKKIFAVLLALVIALSAVTVAFAEEEYKYTCKECGKVFQTASEYNAHIDSHNAPTAPEIKEYQCDTCKKIYDNIEEYNACVDSHYNDINYHYDKYINLSLVDLLGQFVEIFNNTGIFDFFKEVLSAIFEYFTSLDLTAVEQ